MNGIQLFTSEMFGNIRVVTIKDESWFVSKDAAECLWFKLPAGAIKNHVKDNQKGWL